MSGNRLGDTCPSCGSGDSIRLWVATDIYLIEDRIALGKNPPWDGDAETECGECEWEGEARDLVRAPSAVA